MSDDATAYAIVRGKHVITRVIDRHRWAQIDDGAVVQRNGVITAVGTFAALRSENPTAPVIGDGEQVLLPGFVNGHHHIGLTEAQLQKKFNAAVSVRNVLAHEILSGYTEVNAP